MNKVSIIVPVYNTEKYIVRCVSSLVNQSYKDIEIILIDDGSSDNSIKLVEENFNDKRIIVLKQENQGSGQARNNGIKIASGDYLFFVDSDDFIANETLEIMLSKMIEEKTDWAICDYYKYFDENNKEDIASIPNYDKNNSKQTVISMPGAVCKLFKKEIFDKYKIEFLPGVYFEDNAIIPFVCAVSGKFSYIAEPLYYYCQREGSALNKDKYNEGYDMIFDSLSHLYSKFEQYNLLNDYQQELEYIYIEYLLHAANLRFLKYDKRANISRVSSEISRLYPKFYKNNYYQKESIKYKVVCNLFYYKMIGLLKLILR